MKNMSNFSIVLWQFQLCIYVTPAPEKDFSERSEAQCHSIRFLSRYSHPFDGTLMANSQHLLSDFVLVRNAFLLRLRIISSIVFNERRSKQEIEEN